MALAKLATCGAAPYFATTSQVYDYNTAGPTGPTVVWADQFGVQRGYDFYFYGVPAGGHHLTSVSFDGTVTGSGTSRGS
ncbi:MAG TPA: hypothetical protein VN947_10150 [Polyangia bacterium]|nr:hypothetical protein [Polyangia bacterium]